MGERNIANMRSYISNAYKGKEWKNKVSTMSDQQVIAIYYSIKERRTGKKKEKRIKETGQISIFEYLDTSKYDRKLFNRSV